MYNNCEVQRKKITRDVTNSYAYASQNLKIPVLSTRLLISNFSGSAGTQMKETYLTGASTTPSLIQGYRSNLPTLFGRKSEDVNYSQKLNIFASVPPLNLVSGSLNTNGLESIPHISFTPEVHHSFNERGSRPEGSRYMKKALPKITPQSQLDMSPPKFHINGSLQHSSFNHESIFKKCIKPMRQRVCSDNSTDSSKSHSSKFVKTSEGYSGSHRVQRSSSRPRSRRNRIRKSSSPKNFNKKESYNMKRLDLGPWTDPVRHQQELKSRLKTMVFNVKVLKEDQAIVVPSLPTILSTLKP